MIRILIVDDNKDYAKYLSISLTKAGFDVTTITNPLLALKDAIHETYNLILLDLQMPHMDGLTFLKEFSARSLYDSPIWIITAYRDYHYTKLCSSLGATNFFPKDTPRKTITKLIEIYFASKNQKKLSFGT
jgi:DNA-binding response OmpR family regulator